MIRKVYSRGLLKTPGIDYRWVVMVECISESVTSGRTSFC